PAELFPYYRTADVFVQLSEHERFGVPALEAMHFDIPAVAFAAGATPAVVGDGALLLERKDPLPAATAVAEVTPDAGPRGELGACPRRNPRRTDTWALYHFSIGDKMVDDLRAFGVPIALDYHNITEARYFLRWDPAAAITMFDGRRQLASMATDVNFSLADS